MVKFAKKLKTKFKKIIGLQMEIRPTYTCEKKWYGNSYGGFFVNPKLLNKNSIVYSFGIGEDISFDRALIEAHHCSVWGFDPTPKSIKWVNESIVPPTFYFNPYGIGVISGMTTFYLPKVKSHVSGSVVKNKNIDDLHSINVSLLSFLEITEKLKHQSIDVLKIDIEGSEYEIIPTLLNSGIEIKQLLIEFHDRFVKDGRNKTNSAIKLLKMFGYEIFAVSDSSEEVSFIKINN